MIELIRLIECVLAKIVCAANFYARAACLTGGMGRAIGASMSMRRTATLLAVTLSTLSTLALATACSSNSLRPAGQSCSSDGDCAAGLTCLGLGMFSDAGCMTVVKACSKHCQTDTDCTSVGPKFKCFGDCSGTNTCGQTQ
jgi:hypothetical protein